MIAKIRMPIACCWTCTHHEERHGRLFCKVLLMDITVLAAPAMPTCPFLTGGWSLWREE